MSVEFVARAELTVVLGGRELATQMLADGRLALGPEARVAVFYDPGMSQEALLIDSFVLGLLSVDPEHWPDLLERFARVPVTDPEARPKAPAVVIRGGHVDGAWTDVSTLFAEESAPTGGYGAAPEPMPLAFPDEALSIPPPAESPGDASLDGAPKGSRRRGTRLGRLRRRMSSGATDVIGGGQGAGPGRRVAAEHPPQGDAAIRRTPHIDAPDTIDTRIGSRFAVQVFTDSAPLRPGEQGTDVIIDAPPDVESVDVGVVLIVTEQFSVVDDPYRTLTVEREKSDSKPIEFTVEVANDSSERNAGIQALFLYHGRSCGQVGREWQWENTASQARAVRPTGDAPASLPVHIDAQRPDLSVFITAPVNDQMHFNCAVETPFLPAYKKAKVTEFGLPLKAHDYVADKLADLTDAGATSKQRRKSLSRIGYELWDAAPPLFRDALWELVDSGHKPSNIYVASVEPNLPWELMIPNRPPRDGRVTRLGPLGVEFALGRWTHADSESPPQQIPVRDSFVVAPKYPEARQLNSQGEAALLKDHYGGSLVQPVSADFLSFYFKSNHASLLHFACHGQANVADDDVILLEDEERLLAGEVRADEGFQALCEATAPFVFLNACEAGQVVPSIGGGAGFPFAFAMIGARAILAPLWPVDDTQAAEFAKDVYTAALKPDAPPVAEIVRQIRQRAYANPDADTYAAYCFYGDPLARMQIAHGTRDE